MALKLKTLKPDDVLKVILPSGLVLHIREDRPDTATVSFPAEAMMVEPVAANVIRLSLYTNHVKTRR